MLAFVPHGLWHGVKPGAECPHGDGGHSQEVEGARAASLLPCPQGRLEWQQLLGPHFGLWVNVFQVPRGPGQGPVSQNQDKSDTDLKAQGSKTETEMRCQSGGGYKGGSNHVPPEGGQAGKAAV